MMNLCIMLYTYWTPLHLALHEELLVINKLFLHFSLKLNPISK